MIKMIPNILSSLRIICIPFIITLFYLNKIESAITIAIIVAITDCFDGTIARKFHVESEFGAKLDAVGDKFFAIGLLITLSIKYTNLLIILFLEIIISIINLYIYHKTKITKSLLIGKIKTWFLFLAIILGFIACFKNDILIFMNIILFITAIFQIISIICYIAKSIDLKNSK